LSIGKHILAIKYTEVFIALYVN